MEDPAELERRSGGGLVTIFDDIDRSALVDDLDDRIADLVRRAEAVKRDMHRASAYVQHDQKRLLGAHLGMIQMLTDIRQHAESDGIRAGHARGSSIDTSTMTNADIIRAYWEHTGR